MQEPGHRPVNRRPVAVEGRRLVNQRRGGGGAKKPNKIILVVALLLIIGGICVVAYPFILGMVSDVSMNREVVAFTEALPAALPQAEAYQPVDIETLPVDINPHTVPEEIVNDTWYSAEGSAEHAEYLLELVTLDQSICVFPAKNIKQMYPNMRKGASLYPQTATVGTIGNAAMAAHRTGPSDFFHDLDQLQPGDIIRVHTRDQGSYQYEVERVFITIPTDWEVVAPTDYPAMTLTSCQAYGGVSNARRIVVQSRLVAHAPSVSQ